MWSLTVPLHPNSAEVTRIDPAVNHFSCLGFTAGNSKILDCCDDLYWVWQWESQKGRHDSLEKGKWDNDVEIRRTDVPLSHSWVINHPAKIYYSPNSVDSFVGCSWASLPSEFQLEDWLAQRPKSPTHISESCCWYQLGHLDSPPLGLSPSNRLTQLPYTVVFGAAFPESGSKRYEDTCRQSVELT